MTLEQLRVFVAVAERQHLTRAAEALHLTPSAASASIRTLEARYGVRFFHRVGRGIELTETGRLFLGEAQAILARAQAAELVFSDLGGLRRGSVAVHASQTIASYWLPPVLVRFRQRHPALTVRLSVGNTQTVAEAVAEGIADLGFIEGDIDEPRLARHVIAHDRLIVVVRPSHPWAALEAIPPAVFASGPWVMREQGSGTRSAFEAALARQSIAPDSLKVTLELPSNEAILAAVPPGDSEEDKARIGFPVRNPIYDRLTEEPPASGEPRISAGQPSK